MKPKSATMVHKTQWHVLTPAIAAGVLGALGFTVPAAMAQERQVAAAPEGGLPEIVVTARRRAEDLQKVPLTVNAFTAEAIERAGIRNIEDVAKFTPGLVFDKGFAPQDTRLTIRGLPSTSGHPSTGILVDGIDVSSESISTAGGGNLMNLRLFDFERIEVVKGPQSALYGRLAFGGAISYITREPGDVYSANLSLEAAEHNQFEARGGADIPFSERVSMRVNAEYATFDGFYRNTLSGDNIGGYESKGASLTTKFKVGEDSKVVVRLSHARDHNDVRPAYYLGSQDGLGANVPLPANAVGQLIGPSNALSPIPATATQYRPGVITAGPAIALSLDPLTGRDYPGTNSDATIANIHADFSLGWATLSDWTGVVDEHDRTVQDASVNGYPLQQVSLPAPGGLGALGPNGRSGIFQFDLDNSLRQYSQEIRLGDLTSSGFRWAIGGLYWYENLVQIKRSVSAFAGAPGVSQYLNAVLQGGRVPFAPIAGRKTNHYSGYGIVNVDITDKLTATAEARIAREKYDYTFAQSVGVGGTGLNGVAPFILVGTPGTASASTTYFAPRGGLEYKLTPDVLLYASVAKGVKPGGISQGPVTAPNVGNFKPETLWNYEAGAKTTWNEGRFRLNASYFHMDYTNKQVFAAIPVPPTVSPTQTLSLTTNAGAAKVDGGEAELGWLPFPSLTLSMNYTYLKTRYSSYVINSQSVLQIGQAGNCVIVTTPGNTWCQISRTGRQLEQAPKHQLTADATLRRPALGEWDYVGDVALQYRGRRFQEDANQFIYDSFVNVDLRLGLENKRYSVFAFVNNLTNNKTIKSGSQAGDVWAGFPVQVYMIAYAPDLRQVGVRFEAKF